MIVLLFTFIVSTSQAQTIEGSELRNFQGCLAIERHDPPIERPFWHKPVYEEIVSNRFFLHSPKLLGEDTTRFFQEISRKLDQRLDCFTLFYTWENAILEIPEKQLLIASLHNGGHETGRSILTFWRMDGEQLILQHIFPGILGGGISTLKLSQQYTIQADKSLIFAMENLGGDGGYSHRHIQLVHMAPDWQLTLLEQVEVYDDAWREVHEEVDYLISEEAVTFYHHQFKQGFATTKEERIANRTTVSRDTTVLKYADLMKAVE